jgi:arabinogalactan oligomer/maltooligosaccharide transport system permease protein
MDISRPGSDYQPRIRGAAGGVAASLGLLAAALLLAAVFGSGSYWLLKGAFPLIPAYSGLIAGFAALVGLLRWLIRRFQWLMPWYYLLPAMLFLLTFTFFPVLLTIGLAFTDYAGTRKGDLDISSETRVLEVEGSTVTIADPRVFNCALLREGCAGARVVLYASGHAEVAGVALEGTTLTISEPVPAGREVTAVSIFLTAVGDRFLFPVIAQSGTELLLERAPPAGMFDLSEVGLTFDRLPLQRTVLREDGARLTLDAPLPADVEVESIARYNDFGWVGLRNFRTIMSSASRALFPVFSWNVMFAVLTVLLNLVAGVFLAVLLSNPSLRFRTLYRTLLIVPWALPNIITIQVWKGFLNQNFGAINRLLMLLDITPEPVNWLLGSAWSARAALLLVNLWLGYPFMMIATLGALTAIPPELYEAARIDGASAWQGFLNITLPLLRSALVPVTLTSFAFNFNNFNVIFLLTDGGPPVDWGTATARGTDILISWAYNTAFRNQGGYAYGLGSAISLLIFVVTLAVSLLNFRVTGALKEEAHR